MNNNSAIANETRYRHIVWDWNGTLLNDAHACVSIVSNMMEKRGLNSLTMPRYRREVIFPIIRFYERLGFDFSRETMDDLAVEYIDQYLAAFQNCSLQQGAIEALTMLSERGYTHSVLSAYQQDRLFEAIRHYGLSDCFVKVIGLDDYHATSKIENGRQWIKSMDFDRNEVVMVGDMYHDFEVATAMGIDCVLLTCGHQCRSILDRCGVPLFDTMDQVSQWLLDRYHD